MNMKWLILASGIIANTSASVLIKIAITPPRKFPSPYDCVAAFTNWPFWLGLALYGSTFLIYTIALTRLPMNVAQPVLTSGAIVAVTLYSIFIFHEPFHWTTGIGIFLVVVGVALITARII